jgi:hypothetical protein
MVCNCREEHLKLARLFGNWFRERKSALVAPSVDQDDQVAAAVGVEEDAKAALLRVVPLLIGHLLTVGGKPVPGIGLADFVVRERTDMESGFLAAESQAITNEIMKALL